MYLKNSKKLILKTLLITRHILFGGIILILVAMPTIPLIVTITSWDGTCYGFTDGTWPCTWAEYASIQMGYMVVFSSMPLALFSGLWLFLTIIHIILKKRGEKAS